VISTAAPNVESQVTDNVHPIEALLVISTASKLTSSAVREVVVRSEAVKLVIVQDTALTESNLASVQLMACQAISQSTVTAPLIVKGPLIVSIVTVTLERSKSLIPSITLFKFSSGKDT